MRCSRDNGCVWIVAVSGFAWLALIAGLRAVL